jgi:sugar (pentulose or hexulose) kinase
MLAMGAQFAMASTVTPSVPRALAPITGDACALGFDFGTSGVRCAIVNADGEVVASPPGYVWGAAGERSQEASDWETALFSQLEALPAEIRAKVERIAVSGTSGSMLLVDGDECGSPSAARGAPRMYDFSVTKQAAGTSGEQAMDLLRAHTPEAHTVRSATSALAKLLAYHCESPLAGSERLAHQADYVASRLTGSAVHSDWHNALKLGYDVKALRYPEWMETGPIGEIVHGRLPPVVRPGEPIAPVSVDVARKYGLKDGCVVVGGTTDSIAAFLAAGATEVGDAVTSLGSTVAIKLLSDRPVDDATRGVYSHRLGDRWLVGGASNAGCAVLREQGFGADELASLSEKIDPEAAPPHDDYYPLSANTVGERFPRPDENAVSRLTPVPPDRSEFLHCILHGIGRVEAEGYAILAELGASKLERVMTSGGGSQNPTWIAMRQRMLGVPTSKAKNIDAAYGCALLAARGA